MVVALLRSQRCYGTLAAVRIARMKRTSSCKIFGTRSAWADDPLSILHARDGAAPRHLVLTACASGLPPLGQLLRDMSGSAAKGTHAEVQRTNAASRRTTLDTGVKDDTNDVWNDVVWDEVD